jgi:hypothetical protein
MYIYIYISIRVPIYTYIYVYSYMYTRGLPFFHQSEERYQRKEGFHEAHWSYKFTESRSNSVKKIKKNSEKKMKK